jgi:aspartate aminotransferase-like enzyme
MTPKLFIPGPIAVSEKTYVAMAHPMIGHRGKEFVALYESLQEPLKELFGTRQGIYLSTSSAWGIMEGALRNLVQRKVLCCMCGAFSDKWLDVARRCGFQAEGYEVPWGQPLDPEEIRRHLATGEFDCITMVHNETSTGVLNPLPDIMAVVREFPEVMSIVDTVSSFSAIPLAVDELGCDVVLTGSQKALALPPGLALFTVSERAHERAAKVEGRGYYFDFLEFRKNHEQSMTPSTPCISLFYGLQSKLREIVAEGLEARFARHAATNALVHDWVEKSGFELFPPKAFASKTLTTVANKRQLDMDAVNKALKERHHMVFNTGYGKIKGTTFRISNMGDETLETISDFLAKLDEVLKDFA